MSQSLGNSARVLGLFAVALSLDCGSSGTVSTPEYAPLGTSSPVAWSTLVGPKTVALSGVTTAPDGTVRMAATLSGDVTIGATSLVTAGGEDVLVAALGAEGEPLWARNYGDASDQSASGAVVDGEGNVIVAGTFAGVLDFETSAPALEALPRTATDQRPGTAPMRAAGTTDAFVAKLDHLGNLIWSTHLGGAGTGTRASSVALGANGAIALTGAVGASLEESTAADRDDTTAFVALLDDGGRLQWTKSFGGGGADAGTSVALDAGGEVAVTGTYEGAMDLGAGQLPTFGSRDVFVAKLDARGATVWSSGSGGPADDDAVAVAFDPSGDVVALGNFTGAIAMGAGSTAPSPVPDLAPAGVAGRVRVAKLGPAGEVMWVERFGSGDPLEKATAMAVDTQGNVYVAGQLRTAFDFGTCTLAPTTAVRAGQAFVVMTTSGGHAICGERYGLGPEAEIPSIVMAPVRGLVMGGSFEGALDLGQGTFSASSVATFVAREEPIPQPLQ